MIKENQIGGNIEGTITDLVTQKKVISVEPADLYFCRDCMRTISRNVQGGLKEAQRRQRELDQIDRTDFGQSHKSSDRLDER